MIFRDLRLLEVQETFYRPVSVTRATRWRRKAPEGFAFTVKASQFITHEASSPTYRRAGLDAAAVAGDRYGAFRDTPEVWAGWQATEAVSMALEAPAIVFETPASFGPTSENTKNLYGFFERARGRATFVWEPRGGWPSYVVEKVCSDLGLVHGVDPFADESTTIGIAYFRLHGAPPGEKMHRSSYTGDDLNRLRDIAVEYDDAYVLFDNVTSFDDARRFQRRLEASD